MANQDLGFSSSPETVRIGKITYGETYGNLPQEEINSNKTLTGGNVNTKKSFYRYPLTKLEDYDDYLEIKIREYVYPKFTVNAEDNLLTFESSTEAATRQQVNTKYRIQLPIPSGIQDTNQVKWDEDSLNSLEALGIGGASEILQSKNPATGFIDAIQNIFKAGNDLALTGGQDLVTSFTASKLIGMFGSNVSAQSILKRTSGVTLNPNMELLFSGPTLRTFNFSFDLTPRDKLESLEIKNIIRIMKKSMSPKTSIGGQNVQKLGSGVFIGTPDVFELEYKNGSNTHPFLHKFKPCALSNISVDYTASGPYATYNDGTPVHMKLSLQFTELNPIYAENYNDLTDLDGVGY